MDLNNIDLKQFEEDLKNIKQSLRNNRQQFNTIISTPAMTRTIFIAAMLILSACLYYYFLDTRFGSITESPSIFKIIGIAIILLFVIAGIMLKLTALNKGAKNVDKGYSLGQLLYQYFSSSIFVAYYALLGLTVFFIIYLTVLGLAQYNLTVITLGIAIILITIPAFFHLREFMILGFWFLVTGLASLFIIDWSIYIKIIIIYACGLFIFSIITGIGHYIKKRR